MKRIRLTALLLSLVMMIALLPVVQVSAASSPVLNVEILNPSIEDGDTVSVAWSFTGGTLAENAALKYIYLRIYYLGSATPNLSLSKPVAYTTSGVVEFDLPSFVGSVSATLEVGTSVLDTGKVWVDGWYLSQYYVNGKTAKSTWILDGEDWRYFNKYGYQETGAQKIGGANYFFNNYVMVTGWDKHDYAWHYYGKDGAQLYGWQKIKGEWYFLDHKTGVMQYAGQWNVNIDGRKYSFEPNGVMRKGWFELSAGEWVYLDNPNGYLRTGWFQADGAWYFANSSGIMQTGWLLQGNTWYYLRSNGRMASGNNVLIGGALHTFASNGAWVGYVANVN